MAVASAIPVQARQVEEAKNLIIEDREATIAKQLANNCVELGKTHTAVRNSTVLFEG
jgi:hypothetical protein